MLGNQIIQDWTLFKSLLKTGKCVHLYYGIGILKKQRQILKGGTLPRIQTETYICIAAFNANEELSAFTS